MRHQHILPIALRAWTIATLVAAQAMAAEPEPTPEARAHFKSAVAYIDAERYEDAYRELRAAYEATPTWKILGNLGVAADHLERDGEAIDAFEDYVKRGGPQIGAEESAEIRGDLKRLRAGIATVSVEAPGATSFWVIDTRTVAPGRIVNRYGPFDGRIELRVRAGKHVFELEGGPPSAVPWGVSLLPGDSASHSFAAASGTPVDVVADFEPAVAPMPVEAAAAPSHTASYVLWGAGGVAAGASMLLFLESNRIQSEANRTYAERCPFGASEMLGCEVTTSDSKRAANWRTASLITAVGAVGALVTGTVLYFMGGAAAEEGSTEAALQPWVSPESVGVRGNF